MLRIFPVPSGELSSTNKISKEILRLFSLETIIEIGDEYKELFLEAGGEKLDYVESLNYSDLWADAIIDIIK